MYSPINREFDRAAPDIRRDRRPFAAQTRRCWESLPTSESPQDRDAWDAWSQPVVLTHHKLPTEVRMGKHHGTNHQPMKELHPEIGFFVKVVAVCEGWQLL